MPCKSEMRALTHQRVLRYIADADAWRLLADTRSYVAAKQIEMRDALASFEKSKNDSGLG
jgi:hypothetical protein